jgi:hypothetical protein
VYLFECEVKSSKSRFVPKHSLTLIVTLAAPTIPPSFYERGVTFPRFHRHQNLDRHHAANVTAMEHYDFLRFSFPSVVAQAQFEWAR